MYEHHTHDYQPIKQWNHPKGTLFRCMKCAEQGLYSFKFMRATGVVSPS